MFKRLWLPLFIAAGLLFPSGCAASAAPLSTISEEAFDVSAGSALLEQLARDRALVFFEFPSGAPFINHEKYGAIRIALHRLCTAINAGESIVVVAAAIDVLLHEEVLTSVGCEPYSAVYILCVSGFSPYDASDALYATAVRSVLISKGISTSVIQVFGREFIGARLFLP